MRVVQMTRHQVVQMVSVRHGLVPTSRPVHMARFVALAGMIGGAHCGICRVYPEPVFVKMIAVRAMQVAVVQVVYMSVVQDGGVATPFAVDVGMIFMNVVAAFHQDRFLVSSVGKIACAGTSLAWASALNKRSTICWSFSE